MATLVLACSAVDVAHDEWTMAGFGESKEASVARPDDDDTTYIRSTAQNQIQSFDLGFPVAIRPDARVDSVRITARAKGDAAFTGSIVLGVETGGATADGSTHTTPASGDGYSDFTSTFTTTPGGAPWRKPDLESLKIRVTDTHATRRSRVTTLYCTVAYNTMRGRGRGRGA